MRWFDEQALKTRDGGLHTLSAWDYLSASAYDDMVYDGLRRFDPAIQPGDTVFELGVGVGAVLKVLQAHVGEVRPGGCDTSTNAVNVVQELFPSARERFMVAAMTDLRGVVANQSYDHVLSFGALAMYLLKGEMEAALREAVRAVAQIIWRLGATTPYDQLTNSAPFYAPR